MMDSVWERKGINSLAPRVQAQSITELDAESRALPRKPSYIAMDAVRSGVRALLAEGFDYRESMTIVRAKFADLALEQSGRSQKKACARIKISRQALRMIRARARECAL